MTKAKDAEIAGYATLASLSAGGGGTVLLNQDILQDAAIAKDYARSIRALETYPFWTAGAKGAYRPETGLWAPQRKAVAFALAYLACQRRQAPVAETLRESALVKMPTGTGKTGVIAMLACCALGVRRTIILTPRKALVEQMIMDLAWRFWKRFDFCYLDSALKPREGVKEGRLSALERQREHSVEILRNEGYERIWANRSADRQVIVGTFNALHTVLGLKPPAHRSMEGRSAPKPSAVLAECKLETGDGKGTENFRKLLRETDLLIVDEGHYEPAYSWAQCVNAINAPTVLFSATPYRNDYKYFKVHGNFAFNLPFEEAVKNRLIRQVVVEPDLPAVGGPARQASELAEFVTVVRNRAGAYPLLPEGRPEKCIVHGATYENLKRLQCEFYKQDRSMRAVLIHDAHVGTDAELNGDLKKLGRDAVEALGPYRFQHVADAVNPKGPGPQARIWLHQYKLLEGIDNADFIEVFLFDGFRNARQLVQQIGRALRYADSRRRKLETARLFGSRRAFNPRSGSETTHAISRKQWLNYLAYEEYAGREPKRTFTAETQLLALLKKTAPDWQYFAGDFRKGFFTDENATMAEYVLPRRAVVCHYEERSSDEFLDGDLPQKKKDEKPSTKTQEIADEVLDCLVEKSIQAFQLEDRFDVRSVPPPDAERGYEDVRVIRYLAWGNSKLLRRQSLPEWKLGVMAIVRANPFVFLIDTEGVCIDFEKLGLFSPSPDEMKRLFSETELDRDGAPRTDRIRIVEVSAVGLDLSEISIRSMTIRKRNLNDGYFDLAEASQAPSSLHGVAVLGDRTTRRQLSIRRGRVADPTTRNVAVRDYAEWARLVATALADKSIVSNSFFGRFALEVAPPSEANGSAQSLLLDIWDLLNADDAAFDDKEWDANIAKELLDFDMCMELEDVSDAKDGSALVFMLGGRYAIRASYTLRKTVPPKGRYTLSCKELDEAIRAPTGELGTSEVSPFGAEGNRTASLVSLINNKQCFRIIPADPDVVYANGVFFKPSIDWDAIREGSEGNLLDLIVVAHSLKAVVSEKGESGVTPANWEKLSQFGLVVSAFQSATVKGKDSMLAEIARGDVLVCDDGSTEIGDFLCLDTKQKRITLIHAKASDGVGGVSVDKLQVVGRQASASLAFVGSTRSRLPYPGHWEKDLVIKNRQSKRIVKKMPRIYGRNGDSPRDVHAHIVAALADPAYRREVWVMTTGLFSRKKAMEALGAVDRKRGALQFAYYLADLRTAFGRAAVGLRIFTGE